MAIKEVRREWDECQLDYVKEFILHTEADVADLPECCVGSTAIVGETGNVYVSGKGKAWKKREEAMVEGPGAGGGQADWNAKEGEPGHILNKPFGEEYGVIIPETTLAFAEMEGMLVAMWIDDGKLALGETYAVTYNGVVYNCECFVLDGTRGLGNVGVLTGEPGTEPFLFALDNGMVVSVDGSTEAVFSISGNIIKPIDEKFAPFHITTVDLRPEIVSANGSGNFSVSGSVFADIDNAVKTGLLRCETNFKYNGVGLFNRTVSYDNVEKTLFAVYNCSFEEDGAITHVFTSNIEGKVVHLGFTPSTFEVDYSSVD